MIHALVQTLRGEVGLAHFLVLSCVLFALGLATTLARREPLRVWMGILMMLSAAATMLAAFARFAVPAGGRGEGGTFALLIVGVMAIEAAAAAAMSWNLLAATGSADLDRARRLAG